MTTAETKAIFKMGLEQAALKDLQFTLRIAEERLRFYHVSDETLDIMRQMRQREQALQGVRGTKAMQAESLRLVSRYRASIPGYGSLRKHIGFVPGFRRDGRVKYVAHRTLLAQRTTPLSEAEVQALIQTSDIVPVLVPKPAKAKATEPPPMPQTKLSPNCGCPVCRQSRQLVQTTAETFSCQSCGITLTVTHRRAQAA
jgi:hypothetical protein